MIVAVKVTSHGSENDLMRPMFKDVVDR